MQTDPPQGKLDKLVKLYHSGKMIRVIHTCKELLKTYKKSLILFNILGAALQSIGRFDEAIDSYNQAIQIYPNNSDTHYNLGFTFQNLSEFDNAVNSYNKAIQLKPDYVDAYGNLGNALRELGRLDDSINSYNKVIQLKPDYAEAYSNRGNALRDLDQFDEAIKDFNKAIQLKPDYAEAYNNLGNTLQDKGRLNEAKKNFNKAIQLKPDYAVAHWNLSSLLLSLGDFEQGWKKYEYGKKLKEKNGRILTQAPYLEWNDESLKNKKILITAEQGVGDEVMFASCIPDVINKNPEKIIIECDSRLVPLFERSFTQVVVIQRKERNKADWLNKVGEMDFQVAIGSLPKKFRQKLSDFPSRQSFLTPDNMLRTRWRQRYNDLGEGLKIGISWTGGHKKSAKKARSTTLKQWLPLLGMDAYFINLQYGDHRQELQQLEASTGVHIYDWDDADPLTDLDNQAAQIAELDLVLSFPNAAVHVAGSVGTPTWVLLPFSPDFRWIVNRNDSPWYPSVKSFRQQKDGDWETVISRVKKELNILIH